MLLLVFLGGVLTILSPCVLPIVPLVFARAGRPFVRSTLPMLVGLALTFAATASLATVSAAWVVRASELGRGAAIALLALVAASLLVPAIAERLTRPLVRLGDRAQRRAGRAPGLLGDVAVGAAVGLLWAPCAGPILGLVVAAAAIGGSPAHAVTLFAVFAAGAAVSLGVALAAGGRALGTLRRYLGADAWVRRGLGAAALVALVAIATGRDRDLFARAGIADASGAENALVRAFAPTSAQAATAPAAGQSLDDFAAARARPAAALGDEGAAPEFAVGRPWINSAPLRMDSLRGRVVLVDFWTFACYNCLNALPHVKALEAKYRARGLVVIGVHTPELPHEKIEANVRRAVHDLDVTYPVVIDDDYAIWNAYRNHYWPAVYLVDATGHIRFHHFGEGRYAEQDAAVDQLLRDAGR
jgi:cytochrome c biogenesis protein CcdA/thiol-disulfide isomerase/thioredoxin